MSVYVYIVRVYYAIMIIITKGSYRAGRVLNGRHDVFLRAPDPGLIPPQRKTRPTIRGCNNIAPTSEMRK